MDENDKILFLFFQTKTELGHRLRPLPMFRWFPERWNEPFGRIATDIKDEVGATLS